MIIKSGRSLEFQEWAKEFERRGFDVSGEQVKVTKVYDLKAAAPSLPSEEELRSLSAARGLKISGDILARSHAYFASDERVDAHGDIVRQDFDFSSFEKNAPFLLSHDWYSTNALIGQMVKWEVVERKDKDYAGPALLTIAVQPDAGVSASADQANRLIKSGVLRAASIGFYPLEVLKIDDQEERAKLGLGPDGFVIQRSRLIEMSAVPLPANEGAHVITGLAGKGALQADDVTVLREIYRLMPKRLLGNDAWVNADRTLVACAKTAFRAESKRFAELKDRGQSLIRSDESPILWAPNEADTADRSKAIEAKLDHLTKLVEGIVLSQDSAETRLLGIEEMVKAREPKANAKGPPTAADHYMRLTGQA